MKIKVEKEIKNCNECPFCYINLNENKEEKYTFLCIKKSKYGNFLNSKKEKDNIINIPIWCPFKTYIKINKI